MKRHQIILSLLGAGLACGSWAFVEGRPPGAEFFPEQSQEVISAQQYDQATMGEVGVVPESTREESTSNVETSPGAAGTVARAGDPNAAAALRVASNRPAAGGDGFAWWGLAALAIFGVGGVLGARRWIASNVPEMPVTPRKPRG